MKIGMILDNTFPPDSRVENEATSLVKDGHSVHLFCLNEGGQPVHENIRGIEVRRFPTNNLEYKLSALAYSVPFYHWLMEGKIRAFIREVQPDVLHVHDLAIARAAFRAAGKFGLPVVLDLHENRPVIMKEYVHVKKWPGKWLISPERWEYYQRLYSTKADRVIVVTREAANEMIRDYSISVNKVVVVPNTVETSIYMNYPTDPEIVNRFSEGFNILYMGDTGLRRGTDTAIRAMPIILGHIPDARLILVGSNTEDVHLKRIAAEEGVSAHVYFEGWQDVTTFPSYVEAAHLCVSPLKRNRHHDTTFANKIFQYMAGGKPLVVSDCPPQARVVHDSACGLVHIAEDAEGLASKIIYIYDHPEKADEMGRSARRSIEEEWNWEHTSRGLLSLYRELSSESV